MALRRWRVRISEPAQQDFVSILQWTAETFGSRQVRVYRDTLTAALGALLDDGPYLPGSAARDEILPGLRQVFELVAGADGGEEVVRLTALAHLRAGRPAQAVDTLSALPSRSPLAGLALGIAQLSVG